MNIVIGLFGHLRTQILRIKTIVSNCELIALITIHLRFVIDGEIVLGANFMVTEIKPKFLENRYQV
jgi:hypothetical protein